MWGLFHKPWHKDPYQTTMMTHGMWANGPRISYQNHTVRCAKSWWFSSYGKVCGGSCDGGTVTRAVFGVTSCLCWKMWRRWNMTLLFFWILRVRVHYIRFFNRTNSMVLIRLQLSWCVGFFEKKRGVSFSPKRTMDLCGMIEIHIRSLHWYSIFGVDSKNNLWTNKESRLMAPRLTGNTVRLGGFAAANLKLKVN